MPSRCFSLPHDGSPEILGEVADFLQSTAIALVAVGIKENKYHISDRSSLLFQEGSHSACGYCACLGYRIAIGSCANRREGDTGQTVFGGEFQAFMISASQELRFACATAMPDGADCMDHVFGFEVSASANHGVSCL